MKKFLTVVVVALLAWNAWLTDKVLSERPSSPSQSEEETDESTVISKKVIDFSNDITKTVNIIQPSVVAVTGQNEDTSKTVSGFIYSSNVSDCWIVTSNDVLLENAVIRVRFDNGMELEGELAGADPDSDIALILTHPSFETTAMEIADSSLVHQGEYVISVGARLLDTQCSPISSGIVSLPSQLYRSLDTSWITQVLVTDVSLPKLGTGGPLVNMDGQLIGMMSSSLSASTQLSGMNSAVCSRELVRVVEEFKNEGQMTRAYLGVIGRNVEDLAIYEKSAMNITLDTVAGVVVTMVEADSPAMNYGLQKGDVIMAVNGEPVRSLNDLYDALYSFEAGTSASFTIARLGTEAEIEMELQ